MWLLSLLGSTCALLGVGALAGSITYFMLTCVCVALGAALLLAAGPLALLGRPSGTARSVALVFRNAGAIGLAQVLPLFPVSFALAEHGIATAKRECAEVFSAIETWKTDHGSYPETLDVVSHPLVDPEWKWISAQTGAGLYERDGDGYTVSIFDPSAPSNDIVYHSESGLWDR